MESINIITRHPASIRLRGRSLLVFSLFIALFTGMAATTKAQTFAEWFQQGKTQKKYLLQQIVALQAFSGCLRQGYRVASTGLGSISGSLNTENNLHATYYDRMETVDPVVKNNDMVKEILAWQKDILTRLAAIGQIPGLTAGEKAYLSSVRSAVLKDCDNQINTLQNIVCDGKLKMSDAERISAISRIHTGMMDNYRFASGFAAQATVYAARRQQEQLQLETAKRLYAIN